VIDPIDGTRAFISGVPVWGTLIGLQKNGRAIMGMIEQPFTGERYFADESGSYLHRARRRTDAEGA
jgi:myo-inositol-1(or 4)-monophosphatase